ncbi:MAG: cyclase family protein [Gammaproteobacteria bacterium]|nr:cyclase family protein [Gammaproteobacteria bacterium]
MRNNIMFTASATLALATLALAAVADDWYPSKYGADDTLGAINNLSPEKVIQAVKLVKTGKTYPLGVVTGWETPAYPPRQYSITIIQPGQDLPFLGANKATGNDDLLVTWLGIGSQIDGLGHMGLENVYYNGNHAKDFATTRGLTKLSVDKLPPIVTRGVLLDMTDYYDQAIVEAGTAFNSKEIKAQAKKQGITIGKGDVVLFHTGWQNLVGVDNARFMAGQPGLGVDGARYLATLDVVAIGADTWALEVLPSENPELAFPVHPELLAKNGIYILENMDVRALAADEGWEFLFVLGQPRFEGSVQAIINPVAIR